MPVSESSVNGEVRPNAEENLEEAATEQSKVLGAKAETRTEVGTSSRQPQNWLEEEDLVDEGAEHEGIGGREGKR
jgi:hypothetical protein